MVLVVKITSILWQNLAHELKAAVGQVHKDKKASWCQGVASF